MKNAAGRVATVAAVSAITITGLAGTAFAQTSVFEDAKGDMKQGADIRRFASSTATRSCGSTSATTTWSGPSGAGAASPSTSTPTAQGPAPSTSSWASTFEGGDYALLPADGFQQVGRRQVPLHGGRYLLRLDFVEDVARITIDQVVVGDPEQVRVEVKTGTELRPRGQHLAGPGRGRLAGRAEEVHPVGGTGLIRLSHKGSAPGTVAVPRRAAVRCGVGCQAGGQAWPTQTSGSVD